MRSNASPFARVGVGRATSDHGWWTWNADGREMVDAWIPPESEVRTDEAPNSGHVSTPLGLEFGQTWCLVGRQEGKVLMEQCDSAVCSQTAVAPQGPLDDPRRGMNLGHETIPSATMAYTIPVLLGLLAIVPECVILPPSYWSGAAVGLLPSDAMHKCRVRRLRWSSGPSVP